MRWEQRWTQPDSKKDAGLRATLGTRPGFIVNPCPYPAPIYKWTQGNISFVIIMHLLSF